MARSEERGILADHREIGGDKLHILRRENLPVAVRGKGSGVSRADN